MTLNIPSRSILILVDTLLYPARRNGMSVRYFPLVRSFAKKGYTVDVLVINKFNEQYSQRDIQGLRQYCRYVDVIEPVAGNEKFLRRWWRRVRNVAHLMAPFGRPYKLIDNQQDYYIAQVCDILASRDLYTVGVGVSVGGNNAGILLSLPDMIRPRRILCDFIDSAYLLKKRARIGRRRLVDWFGLLEEWKIRRWERSICRHCPCVYISKKDAESTGGLAHVIPNSIVEDGFDVATLVALEHPNIAFFGNMAYSPNAEGGAWLARELFPLLKESLPGLHCYIIGRNPGEDLRRLCQEQGIHITGEVDNIWSYIRSVDVFVFPLFSGAGMQNKVLEAMHAGKPVVCTPIANEAIGAVHGEHIYLASNQAEFMAEITLALADDDKTGRNASEFVNTHFSITSVADRYAELLEG